VNSDPRDGAEPWDGDPSEPAVLPEAVLPEAPTTGDDAVDRATAEVAQALHDPLEQQVTVIDAAHRTLQDRLADVEG
jgi:hypothetical protein